MAKSRIVRVGTVTVLWLAAAAGATAVGMTAVGMIGSDIFGSGQDPLTAAEVEQRLASPAPTAAPTETPSVAPSPTPTPTGTPSSTPSETPSTTPVAPPAPEPQSIAADGAGTVIAHCNSDGTVTVVSAVPAQGFEVDSDDDDRDDHPQIKFESDDLEVEVRLRCVDGAISPEIRHHAED
ncbi:hypothetical protein E1212_17955 [Jiangella ureilytica]|uniref:Septum formation initiator n=1 Tax=Jiangella ureilytica TaxID=2530374 RepID=A0A4R4RJQ8_9ACTN|nr:hypothetical protein [Jiangella ureilytica]TDC49556.1 hypothetical protein E1212_17955 [Jiangella ureilytica]